MDSLWVAFGAFVAALVPLLIAERWIHRHLQGVALLLSGDPEMAVWLYALPLLPGVLLHEMSHALAAWLLGVRVGRVSVLPRRQGDRIQLGFVPVERAGSARTAVIGLAPLVTGCLALLLIGHFGLRLGPVGAALAVGDWDAAWMGLREAIHAPDAWVWAYLAFAISNTMLPSRSDLRAWPTLIVFVLGVGGIVALLGMGPALVSPLTDALRWLAVASLLTLLVDLPFALLILGIERVLERVRGMRVEYR